jgi:hypothetical protein
VLKLLSLLKVIKLVIGVESIVVVHAVLDPRTSALCSFALFPS